MRTATARLGIILCALLLQACGTHQYTPTEYPLRDGLIPAFDVAGPVTITNAQPSTKPTIVSSYGGTSFSSSLNAITEGMVQQTIKELEKNGRKTGGGSPKTIALKVNSLLSEYGVFVWKSNLQFQATLGNGEVIETKVPHASGMVLQDLNGCIAESVMMLLKNDRVRTYLAK